MVDGENPRQTEVMNELPVIGYRVCTANSGIVRGLEGNVWRKVVSTPKNMVLGRDQRFCAVVLSQMDLSNVDTWKM